MKKKINKERQGFNFLKSYYEVLKMLENDSDKLSFIEALCERQFDGIERELEGMVKFAYNSQKHAIDASRLGWEDAQKKEYKEAPKHRPSTPPSEGVAVGGSVHPKGQEKEKEKEEGKEKEQEQEKVLIPELSDFMEYAKKIQPNVLDEEVRKKYYIWVDQGWNILKDNKPRPIRNWKSTLGNTVKYLECREIDPLVEHMKAHVAKYGAQ